MFLSLDEAKAHCSVVSDEFDDLLRVYIEAAEAQAANYLDRDLLLMCGTPPDPAALPVPVRVGILYYVADMFAQRETFVVGSSLAYSPTADRLMFPYRQRMGV